MKRWNWLLPALILLGCSGPAERPLGIDAGADADAAVPTHDSGMGDGDLLSDAEMGDAETEADIEGDIEAGIEADIEGDVEPTSCLEILERAEGRLVDGVYTVDISGEPREVYCDMTTEGGGWTALLNPVDLRLPSTHPSLSFSGVALPGEGSCPADAALFEDREAWWGLQQYVCGHDTAALTITWEGVARDVMFLATVQGQETHTVMINGTETEPDGVSDEYMRCYFWNGEDVLAHPVENGCWSTVVEAAPHVALGAIAGSLEMIVEAGPSCSPDCRHGAGLNVTRLFVR